MCFFGDFDRVCDRDLRFFFLCDLDFDEECLFDFFLDLEFDRDFELWRDFFGDLEYDFFFREYDVLWLDKERDLDFRRFAREGEIEYECFFLFFFGDFDLLRE